MLIKSRSLALTVAVDVRLNSDERLDKRSIVTLILILY